MKKPPKAMFNPYTKTGHNKGLSFSNQPEGLVLTTYVHMFRSQQEVLTFVKTLAKYGKHLPRRR